MSTIRNKKIKKILEGTSSSESETEREKKAALPKDDSSDFEDIFDTTDEEGVGEVNTTRNEKAFADVYDADSDSSHSRRSTERTPVAIKKHGKASLKKSASLQSGKKPKLVSFANPPKNIDKRVVDLYSQEGRSNKIKTNPNLEMDTTRMLSFPNRKRCKDKEDERKNKEPLMTCAQIVNIADFAKKGSALCYSLIRKKTGNVPLPICEEKGVKVVEIHTRDWKSLTDHTQLPTDAILCFMINWYVHFFDP
jgi:hypothetical protein